MQVIFFFYLLYKVIFFKSQNSSFQIISKVTKNVAFQLNSKRKSNKQLLIPIFLISFDRIECIDFKYLFHKLETRQSESEHNTLVKYQRYRASQWCTQHTRNHNNREKPITACGFRFYWCPAVSKLMMINCNHQIKAWIIPLRKRNTNRVGCCIDLPCGEATTAYGMGWNHK